MFYGNYSSFQIIGRASQARGSVKTTSRPYFITAYNIENLGSKREIRDKVEQLLEGSRFVYKVRYGLSSVFLLLTVYI